MGQQLPHQIYGLHRSSAPALGGAQVGRGGLREPCADAALRLRCTLCLRKSCHQDICPMWSADKKDLCCDRNSNATLRTKSLRQKGRCAGAAHLLGSRLRCDRFLLSRALACAGTRMHDVRHSHRLCSLQCSPPRNRRALRHTRARARLGLALLLRRPLCPKRQSRLCCRACNRQWRDSAWSVSYREQAEATVLNAGRAGAG